MLLMSALALAAAGLAGGLAAAQEDAQLTVEIAAGEGGPPTVGDPIVFRVEVRHAEDARVEVDSAMTELGRLDAALAEIELVEPGLTLVVWRTAAFEVGTFEAALPPIVVVGTGGRRTLTPPPQRIEVVSALPEGTDSEAEARPLTPPQEIEGGSGFAFWIAALLAIGAGFLLARVLGLRTRRRATPRQAPAPEPEPLPTLAEIDQDASAAELCRALAAAVRAHLARRYEIPARSLTSAELPEQLAAAGASASTVQRVRTLLRECDAVTFAEQTPPPERLAGYRELAAAIIGNERPNDAETL